MKLMLLDGPEMGVSMKKYVLALCLMVAPLVVGARTECSYYLNAETNNMEYMCVEIDDTDRDGITDDESGCGYEYDSINGRMVYVCW